MGWELSLRAAPPLQRALLDCRPPVPLLFATSSFPPVRRVFSREHPNTPGRVAACLRAPHWAPPRLVRAASFLLLCTVRGFGTNASTADPPPANAQGATHQSQGDLPRASMAPFLPVAVRCLYHPYVLGIKTETLPEEVQRRYAEDHQALQDFCGNAYARFPLEEPCPSHPHSARQTRAPCMHPLRDCV